jgi:hypothetical protein
MRKVLRWQLNRVRRGLTEQSDAITEQQQWHEMDQDCIHLDKIPVRDTAAR